MKRRILLFGAGVLLMFLVVSLFGLAEVAAEVVRANLLFVLGAIVLQLAVLGLFAVRLRIIGGGVLTFGKAFRVAMTGSFVSLVTPVAKIGGEPLKVYMLRDNYGSSKAAAVVVIDDVVDIVTSVLIVLFTFIFFVPTFVPSLIGMFAAFLLIVIALVAVAIKLFLSPKLLKRIVDWFLDRISKHPGKKVDHVGMFYDSFRTLLLKRRATLAAVISITLAIKLLEFAIIWFAFASIGAMLPWHEVMLIWSIILAFLFVPWLPGSLGLVEFGAASALVALGLSSAAAAGGILINRFASFWIVLAVGLAALGTARKRNELPSAFYVDHEKV